MVTIANKDFIAIFKIQKFKRLLWPISKREYTQLKNFAAVFFWNEINEDPLHFRKDSLIQFHLR